MRMGAATWTKWRDTQIGWGHEMGEHERHYSLGSRHNQKVARRETNTVRRWRVTGGKKVRERLVRVREQTPNGRGGGGVEMLYVLDLVEHVVHEQTRQAVLPPLGLAGGACGGDARG